MAELKTKFIGLELKSPVIAGSCGLTADINSLVEIESAGAGAVILKSVFEEQINAETSHSAGVNDYPEAQDYILNYIRANAIQEHVNLVAAAKQKLSIPVIASINCTKDGEWISFAKDLVQAGADALELNIFMLPLNEFKESREIEEIYYSIVKHVRKEVNVPVIVKIGHYFTNLCAFVSQLKAYGADAVTLFNRFYEPDINIEKITMGVASVFSTSEDIRTSLRWTGILTGKNKQLQVSASTGVHTGEDAVKLLLAGATTVQVCSVMYDKGAGVIGDINRTISSWMDSKQFSKIAEIRGLLSYKNVVQADRYERAQFMKYFSDRKE